VPGRPNIERNMVPGIPNIERYTLPGITNIEENMVPGIQVSGIFSPSRRQSSPSPDNPRLAPKLKNFYIFIFKHNIK
jgi:hypothetical protein